MKLFAVFSTFILALSVNSYAIPRLSQNMMISGPSELALESGLRVGKVGGNVVDVAVAYALTLSVTHPHFGALGGGGFALTRINGETTALDFREEAPAKTDKNYYLKKDKKASIKGGAAVGVPGIPMGLWELHKKYGKLSWNKLFKEALYYTKNGFPVSSEWYRVVKKQNQRGKFWPEGLSHLLNNGSIPLPGSTLKQKGLYQALKKLKSLGPDGFYKGAIAQDIVDSIKATSGDMALGDLENYKAKWRKPISFKFMEHDIVTMPPPSSGGVILKTAFTLVDKLQIKNYNLLSLTELHLLSEVMSRSFRSRQLLGDPDFHNNPLTKIASKKYVNELYRSINKRKAKSLKPLNDKKFNESDQTTHIVVLDKNGNAVSMTLTLNGNFGSGVITKKYGIALNNEMDDFTTRPGEPNMYGLSQGPGNFVEAKKRPLSSMTPTLVLKDGKTYMGIGAPGGPRIINGVFQGIYRVLVNKLNMEQAIFTPRLHHQFLPNKIYFERNRFSPFVLKGLKNKGHKISPIHGVGIVYGVRVNKDGLLEGAADYRGEGFVGGF